MPLKNFKYLFCSAGKEHQTDRKTEIHTYTDRQAELKYFIDFIVTCTRDLPYAFSKGRGYNF